MKNLKPFMVLLMVLCLLAPASADNKPDVKHEKKEAQAVPHDKQAKAVKPGDNHTQAQTQAKAPADDGFDVILLMDSSGSMKKTDPHNYRKAAARLLVSLLGDKEKIGIISFGDTAKTLAPLTANTKDNRSRLFSSIDKITSKEFSTHIHDAVKRGHEELKSSSRKNRILLLMSDGKLTLGDEEEDMAALKELTALLPALAKENIKLYTVAFSELSDSKLLEGLARETGGAFRFAKEDKDIHIIFTSIFERLKAPDTVPIEGDQFVIDKDIREATLVITKKQGTSTSLLDPGKKAHLPSKHGNNIKWFETQVFDMITISEPAPGAWKVKLSSQTGNKVFVITNLTLKTGFNKDFATKGERLTPDVWLEKDGGMIREKDILEKVAFSSDLKAPDGKTSKFAMADNGTSGDVKAGDAVYSTSFGIDEMGEYEVKITAEGKTFKREKTFHLKAAEPKPAPAQPQQAKHVDNKTGPVHKEEASVKSVLVMFGIANLAIILMIVIFIVARKFMGSRKKTEKVNRT